MPSVTASKTPSSSAPLFALGGLARLGALALSLIPFGHVAQHFDAHQGFAVGAAHDTGALEDLHVAPLAIANDERHIAHFPQLEYPAAMLADLAVHGVEAGQAHDFRAWVARKLFGGAVPIDDPTVDADEEHGLAEKVDYVFPEGHWTTDALEHGFEAPVWWGCVRA